MENTIDQIIKNVKDPDAQKRLKELKQEEDKARTAKIEQYIWAMQNVSPQTLRKTEMILDHQFGKTIKKIREEQIRIILEVMTPKERVAFRQAVVEKKRQAKKIEEQPTAKEKKKWGL